MEAKEGYEEQLGRKSEKAFHATYSLILITCSSHSEVIKKLRDLLKRMERALGEDNVVTFDTLNELGERLRETNQYEEAITVHERCLTGKMKVLGEDHKDTLGTVNNLGGV